MMKYFELQFYDNDSYLLEVSKVDRHKYITCSTCKMILDKRNLIEKHLPTYTIKRKKYHLSGSYDGFKVVSQEFKDLYEVSDWQGLVFYPIPKNKGFYLVECSQQVVINETKRPIEFENKCNECGLYMGVYGSVPSYMDADVIQKLKPNTFYRSNLEFGYDFEQGYSLFASQEITDKLIKHKLIIKKDLIEVLCI
ncbi:hypothetical protein LDK11_05380 [Fusobacterium nucleatum]